nr:cobyric acid synthase [Halobacteroides halobius]
MFQGTASDVGKSTLTAAVSRILIQEGYHVAPFKSQNMALNSYVTKKGGEIGRAQAVQAEAAKVEATIDMNPILLKPKEDTTSQVIIHGQVKKNMTAKEYFSKQQVGLQAVKDSLARLKNEYQVVVLEGAGSPAEVNLRDYDMVNMKIAKLAQAPVILVADIDRGGVFASIIGTLELLNEAEQERIKGIIINKFRGAVKRLQSGIDYIEEETGIPILGIIPYISDYNLPEEDSIPSYKQGSKDYQLDIVVVKLPHISNFTDFDALAQEFETRVRYVDLKKELGSPDLIILPGSKNTIEDLEYLYQTGGAKRIIEQVEAGVPVVGICGGYQMLGNVIYDPSGIETDQGEIKGLGLLDIKTTLLTDKVTNQIAARVKEDSLFNSQQEVLTGYEIHVGETKLGPTANHLFEITERSRREVQILDGTYSRSGLVWGTYIHGLFDNDQFRRDFINQLRVKKGLSSIAKNTLSVKQEREKAYNQLADVVREHLDMELLYQVIDIN